VSWLLVALIPGLLMLAAFGLDRLEGWLASEDVPAPVRTDRPVPQLKRPRLVLAATIGDDDRLPTRLNGSCLTNPEFQETRYANRV